jgi:anaerobic selenocysteine-containing dehydrogenase
VPGLGASFGRGVATIYQQDLANSDCILIMGSNIAEAHPVGFRWPMKAREKGGKIIHVDPRFSRTSALADVYVGIRAGSDIALIENGGWLMVVSPRAVIEARALITQRLKLLRVAGRLVHQIGVPFHWGFAGETAERYAGGLGCLVVCRVSNAMLI